MKRKYIIVIRMPSGILLPISEENDSIMEFATVSSALKTSKNMEVCRAYNFQILPVEI
jgi:hypothetical protein